MELSLATLVKVRRLALPWAVWWGAFAGAMRGDDRHKAECLTSRHHTNEIGRAHRLDELPLRRSWEYQRDAKMTSERSREGRGAVSSLAFLILKSKSGRAG